jgi:uncharacterized protein (DUF1778 family)
MAKQHPTPNRISFRATDEEAAGFEMAAELSGVTLSAWIRSSLREETERRLANAEKKAPWV